MKRLLAVLSFCLVAASCQRVTPSSRTRSSRTSSRRRRNPRFTRLNSETHRLRHFRDASSMLEGSDRADVRLGADRASRRGDASVRLLGLTDGIEYVARFPGKTLLVLEASSAGARLPRLRERWAGRGHLERARLGAFLG